MSNNDEDPTNFDYIEDPYFNPAHVTETPSFDLLEDDEDECFDKELEVFDLRQLDVGVSASPPQDEGLNVEAEFFTAKRANNIIRAFFQRDLKRQVRVTYLDLTKPYLLKFPKENFRKYLDICGGEEAVPADNEHLSEFSNLSQEERERQQALWNEELVQIESEIATLRTVLQSKMRRSAELKRNLGITVWKEVSEDFNQGIKNVKESNVYHTVESKVGQVTKAVTDAPIYQKTTSLIGGITGNISTKLGQMRHSESFRSIEEKVGSAYENVKTKVVSRSGSQQSLDEAGRSRSGSVITSPSIPEEKPVA